MGAPATTLREIAVPISIFISLRNELKKEAGALPTIHALHHAGYDAGTAAAAPFGLGGSEDGASMGQSAFWAMISGFFARRGWGTLTQSSGHAGIALLSSPDWAEASHDSVDSDASCCFSTGFLSGLLSGLAEAPVAVLEVDCRARGDDQCRFAFGSEVAIHDLSGYLLEGSTLEGALAAL
jgi:hypothetical protein